MQTIVVNVNDKIKKEYIKGIKVKEVLDNLEIRDYILMKYNNKKVNLETELTRNGTLTISDINSIEGNKTYERGLLFLFEYATLKVLGADTKVTVRYSIDKGVYCSIDKEITDKNISDIKKIIKEEVLSNKPFVKIETTKEEAIEYFKRLKRKDKVRTLFYNTSDYIKLYKYEDTYNYIIGSLPDSTGVLKYFDLSLV